MAESNEDVKESGTADKAPDQPERTFTDDEIRAMQHGWTPRDQWQGPEDEWINAKTFNMRGDLFGRIAKDKREISELKHVVSELAGRVRETYDDGFKAGLAQLKDARKQAIVEGDTEKIFEIDEKIDDLREKHATEKAKFDQRIVAPQQRQQANPVFDDWHSQNDWYMNDRAATEYANELTISIANRAQAAGTQVDYPKLLQEVTRKVKQKFPEKFGGRLQDTRPDPVDSGSSSGDNTPREPRGGSEKDMTDQERRIMDGILKSTGMSKKDYLAERDKFVKRKGG